LIPFGSVNLAWPDWQEDVRRCHEVHKMPGLRIYPGYQPFDLSHPALEGNGAVGRMIGTITGLPTARVPVERIVFGSHAPYFPLETAILKLMESSLEAQQLQAIMQGNARRLLPPRA
jgi:hypothetical protein